MSGQRRDPTNPNPLNSTPHPGLTVGGPGRGRRAQEEQHERQEQQQDRRRPQHVHNQHGLRSVARARPFRAELMETSQLVNAHLPLPRVHQPTALPPPHSAAPARPNKINKSITVQN